jgi:hypothetical protein
VPYPNKKLGVKPKCLINPNFLFERGQWWDVEQKALGIMWNIGAIHEPHANH